MNILQVNKYYYPHIGGIETVVEQYSKYLSINNKVNILVCQDDIKLNNELKINGNLTLHKCKTNIIIKKLPISMEFIKKFYKLFFKADIIHIHEPFPLGTLLCLMLLLNKKKKLIITWHSDIVKQKFLKILIAPIYFIVLHRANIILTTSKKLLESSKQLRLFSSKVKIIPLSLPASTVNEGYEYYEKPKFDKYILSYGRLSYYKGIKTIVECYMKYSNLLPPLIICGEGELDQEIINLANKIPNKVQYFHSYIPEEMKVELLKKAIAFLFPSTHKSEAFGITQLEALRQGVPVINTSINTGVPWVSIHEITGLTIEPNSPSDMKDAIIKISEDKDFHKNLSRGAIERFNKYFSDEIVLSELNNIYRSFIDC